MNFAPMVGAFALSTAAVGQSDEKETAAWVESQVAALDSDSFSVRDAASHDLAVDPRVTLQMIEQRLADSARPLSAEQSLRLSEAGLRMFASSPRGAMGVQFANVYGDTDGVKVGMAVDGFDAKRVLKAGDVIREMDGVSLAVGNQDRAHNLIIALIISHDAGEEVSLNVMRAGEPLSVRMRLGSYKDLRNANPLDMTRVRQAWDFRCQRVRSGHADIDVETTEPGISPQRWAMLIDSVRRVLRQATTPQQAANPFAPPTAAEQNEEPTIAMVGGGAWRQLSEPPGDFSAAEHGARNSGRTQQLQQQIDSLNATIRIYERRLKDPNLPEVTRRQLTMTVAQYRQLVLQYRLERRRLLGQVEP
jgi:hypothetical protein